MGALYDLGLLRIGMWQDESNLEKEEGISGDCKGDADELYRFVSGGFLRRAGQEDSERTAGQLMDPTGWSLSILFSVLSQIADTQRISLTFWRFMLL
jgi:hypothetical protein